MKAQLRELFSFTDSERNGTIVLLLLITMAAVIISLQGKFISLPKENFVEFDQFISSVQLKKNSDSVTIGKRYAKDGYLNMPNVSEEAGVHSVYHAKELFDFNPNGLSVDDWVRLGLSPSQARTIKNYESKGGRFFDKADVKKMFVISAERFAELEPYIVLPVQEQISIRKTHPSAIPSSHRSSSEIVELNTADTADLIAVNGIGPILSTRIIAYRELLGGFHSVNQLTEVFGIDAEKFTVIKSFVKVDSSYIRKININTDQYFNFIKLPYISKSVANAILNFRKLHGPFKSVLGIKGCLLVTPELYLKISPYLSI